MVGEEVAADVAVPALGESGEQPVSTTSPATQAPRVSVRNAIGL
ncbi:hypothetical protein [Streptomyces sp. NRRL S-475]|nr:hypothetical protein [Streptomyces sp. NRRL S-475]